MHNNYSFVDIASSFGAFANNPPFVNILIRKMPTSIPYKHVQIAKITSIYSIKHILKNCGMEAGRIRKHSCQKEHPQQ